MLGNLPLYFNMVEFVDNINITRVHMKNAKFSFIQKTLKMNSNLQFFILSPSHLRNIKKYFIDFYRIRMREQVHIKKHPV